MMNGKSLIVTSFLFLQIFPILTYTFLLTMNPDRFSFCTVYLIRNPAAKDVLKIKAMERNEMLNGIQLQNYQAFTNPILFSWVISDTTYPIQTNDEMYTIEHIHKTANSFHSCQIVLTELLMIWRTQVVKYESHLFHHWSTFLSVGTFGYLPKNGKPENTLILAIAQARYKSISLPRHQAHLYSAPFPTFAIFCNVQTLQLVGLYWLCISCQIDWKILQTSQLIAKGSYLQYSFTEEF